MRWISAIQLSWTTYLALGTGSRSTYEEDQTGCCTIAPNDLFGVEWDLDYRCGSGHIKGQYFWDWILWSRTLMENQNLDATPRFSSDGMHHCLCLFCWPSSHSCIRFIVTKHLQSPPIGDNAHYGKHTHLFFLLLSSCVLCLPVLDGRSLLHSFSRLAI